VGAGGSWIGEEWGAACRMVEGIQEIVLRSAARVVQALRPPRDSLRKARNLDGGVIDEVMANPTSVPSTLLWMNIAPEFHPPPIPLINLGHLIRSRI